MALLVTLASLSATAATIFLFLSPWRTIVQIKNGHTSTSNVPILPYLAMAFNCMLWSLYGVSTSNLTICFVNFVGDVLAVYFLSTYYIFAKTQQQQVRNQILAMVAVLGTLVVYVRFGVGAELAPAYLGTIASVASVIMFGSPLGAIMTVLRTKSTETMPPLVSAMSALASGLWFGYGSLIDDQYVIIPNGLGFILGCVQLVVIYVYHKPQAAVHRESLV
eukprot:tig00000025_g7916.t1